MILVNRNDLQGAGVVSTILFSVKNVRKSIVEFVSKTAGPFYFLRHSCFEKSYSGDGMFTLYGWGYNFPNFHRSLSAKLQT